MGHLLRKITASTLLLALVIALVNADTGAMRMPASIYPWVRITIENEINRSESTDWTRALDEALDILPPHIVGTINGTSGLNVTLTVQSQEKWSGRAYPDETTGIYFNERPLLSDYPLASEPIGLYGFSHREKFYVALHELGHIYFFRSGKNPHDFETFEKTVSAKTADGSIVWLEEPPTIYPLREDVNKTAESAAEAFALFVVSPDILESCFPIHYNFMRELFGLVYSDTPDSIITRINCR